MQTLVATGILCAVLAMATDVTGKWAGKVDVGNPGNDPTIPMSLVLKQSGSELTGAAGDASHQFPIESGEVIGDSIKFQLTIGPNIMNFDMRQQDNLLTGTVTLQYPNGGMHKGPATFKRQ